MKQLNRLFIYAAVVLLTLGATGWGASVRDTNRFSLSPSRLTKPERVPALEYTNEIVGITFTYPEGLMIEDGTVRTGDAGQKFSGALTSEDFWISFGGVTKDYSYSRGGGVLDTYGYSAQKGAYHLGYVWGDHAVVPSEFIPTNGGTSKALVIKDPEWELVLDASSTAAFINLPGPLFPGVVFVLSPVRGRELSDETFETFRNIVSSVRFIERQ